MKRVLILYASQEGQTEKIAEALQEIFKEEGFWVALAPFKQAPTLEVFDAIVIGASIHVGQYPQALIQYVKSHAHVLNSMKSAFFSVCLSAADDDVTKKQTAETYIRDFLSTSGWKPELTSSFAGALKYQDYGFFKRQLMKRVAKDLSTDTSQNHEYTDWPQVQNFALKFADILKEPVFAPLYTEPDKLVKDL